MFIIYKSYKLKKLINIAYDIMNNNPLSNPLKSEIFIIPNQETKQWIQIFIANKYKISTNIKFYQLKNFIWYVFKTIIPEQFCSSEFDKYSITWKILNVLETKNLIPEICQKNEDQIHLFTKSSYISDLYQLYLIYRPDWIQNWEKKPNFFKKNPKKFWQQILWMKIINNMKNNKKSILNFSSLLFYTVKNIQFQNHHKKKLPTRIFIFGTSALNSEYILILKSISKLFSIYFFCVTPYFNENNNLYCKEFHKKCNTIKNDQLLSFLYSDKSSTFLKKILNLNENIKLKLPYWNTYEHKYLTLINLIKDKQINVRTEIKSKCLLNNFQKIIFFLYNFKKNNHKLNFKNKKKPINTKDRSISIHICHRPIREVEILHNNLLNLLNNHDDILFQDILIICKNLDIYIPYIKNIFNSPDPKNYLPYIIIKNNIKHSKIFQTLKILINLPNLKLDLNNVINLLNIPHFLNKININEQELTTLLKIIKKTKSIWENTNILSNNSLLDNTIKYWQHGIKRILLGYVMKNSNYNSWDAIIPYDKYDLSYYNIFTKLINFISFLDCWKKKLSKKNFLSRWNLIFEQLINDFFTNKEKKKHDLKTITQKWKKIINSGIKENYGKKISIELFKHEIFNKNLYTVNINHQLFSGKITFCQNFSLRNVPFKIIYILGMDNSFCSPTNISLDTYNLIKEPYRIGDPYNTNKDEFLFLETLLSAKNFFYMSYSTFSENTVKLHEPCRLLKKLYIYISQYFYIPVKKTNILYNNLEQIQNHLNYIHTNYFYDKENFLKKNNYPILNKIWWKIATNTKRSKKNFITTLSPIKQQNIYLTQLILFWKKPIQAFFNYRINIKLYSTKKILINQKNPTIIKFNINKINSNILNFFIQNKNINKLLKYYQNIGIFPNNNIGKIFWEKQIELIKPLYKEIITTQTIFQNIEYSFNLNQYKLRGNFKNVNNKKNLLRWTTNVIKFPDIISLWLEHLTYCYLYKESTSILLSINNSMIILKKIDKKTALKYLNKFVTGYIQGMQKPLFLIQSGINWLNECYDIKNKKMYSDNEKKILAEKKMLKIWHGNSWIQGEKNNLYVKKVITSLNKKTKLKIYNTTKKWILPILEHLSYSKYN